MDLHLGRHRSRASIPGPDQSQMDFKFLLRQASSQQRHHLLGAAPTQTRSQQEDSRTFHSWFPERKAIVTENISAVMCWPSLNLS